ncbi:MAG: hypothetical protein EOO36_15130, partial [Cytophagaceae bacterium]
MLPRRALPLRLLDALLYSSVWLAAAAAAQTAGVLRGLPGGFRAAGWQAVALVFAVTLLTYNLDAALPFKHRQPAQHPRRLGGGGGSQPHAAVEQGIEQA